MSQSEDQVKIKFSVTAGQDIFRNL